MTAKYNIMVIIPIVSKEFNKGIIETVQSVLAPDFDATYENVKSGTNFIESNYAEFLDTPEIIRISKEAQEKGYDGIFIDCLGEPGVSVVRELVNIPVIGGFDAPILTANLISQLYSLVTVQINVVPMLRTLARDLGITQNLTSIRNVNIPVPDLNNREVLIEKLVEESLKAIKIDGAQVIVLGCTGMLGVAGAVAKELKKKGLPAPVVDPTTASIGFLQSLIRNGLSQSRLTYYKPTETYVTAENSSG